ncbi:MAG: LysM peptidoglycan-binding domain-containing protein [Bacteroidetes bacterium]|nr:LysM peptidoglycan-binding domain-containing protein [Bacteroidota bacterium]
MRTFKIFVFLLFLTWDHQSSAQSGKNSRLVVDYVNTYKDIAVFEMLRTRIPASITLAQGILESQCGNSRLAIEGHNHFGIKCKNSWTGKVILEDDDDFQECFRSYDDVYLSYQDHSSFLLSANRYAYLFDLEVTDYKSWAYGLKEAGYATNPTYATQLIELIEKYNLKQYDRYTKASPSLKDSTEKHSVTPSNGIPSTKATQYDTYTRIAIENKLKVSEILKINDLSTVKELHYGDIVYLKTKRNENNNHETHIVESGESMHDISQQYGVKLSLLLERNGLKPGEEPSKGEEISINKKNKREVKKRKVLKDNTKSVDMRIHMGERSKTDSIIEAKFNSESTIDHKLDSAVAKIKPVPSKDSVYMGNPKRNDSKDSSDKQDEVYNNELYHFVLRGETLYSIAKKYKITVEELKALNKIKDNNIHLLQKLQVSNHRLDGIIPPKVYVMDREGLYVIQLDDSLEGIAIKFGITLDEIFAMNEISISDTLKVGNKLRVAKSDDSKIDIPPYHIVSAGDTLESISKKYDIPMATLEKLNALRDGEVTLGMRLYLQ